VIFEEDFSVRYALYCTDEHEWHLSFFARDSRLWFVITLDFDPDLSNNHIKKVFTLLCILTTPLLSTISCIILPFFPITFPTNALGT
jgi:hypothetical protein